MGTMSFTYTGTEAVDIIKNYYPQDWQKRIETKKKKLNDLASRHNISIEKAYRKFIIPVAEHEENIMFFAALSELVKTRKMFPKEKTEEVLRLEEVRENIKTQMVALEQSSFTSAEDKKMLRAYYTKTQEENTMKINDLINSFDVIEPQLIIHQPGLFDISAK